MFFEKVEIKKSDGQLKRLGFVRMIAINALVCVSNLYEYAKQSSGPLKSTVETVESTVTTVVGPVYLKFKGVPVDLLVFLDEKVLSKSSTLLPHFFVLSMWDVDYVDQDI